MVALRATSSHIIDWAQAAARFADVTVMGFQTGSPEKWEWINKGVAVREEQGIHLVLVPQGTVRPSRMWRLNAAMKTRMILRAHAHLESTIGVPDIIQGHWYPEAAVATIRGHHFPSANSSNSAMSNSASARSLFTRVFSASSS